MVKHIFLFLLISSACFSQAYNDDVKLTVAQIVAKDSVNLFIQALDGSSVLTDYKLPLDSLKKYLEGYIQIALLDTMTYYDDILFPLIQGKLPASNYPDMVTYIGGTQALAFDKATDQTVFSSTELLHKWKIGTDIECHIHWGENATPDTGSVVWGLEVAFAPINSAFAVLDTFLVTDAAESVAYKHHDADFGDLDMSAYADLTDISGNFFIRFFRDANNAADTYDYDAYAVTVGFHIEIDSFGSRGELYK